MERTKQATLVEQANAIGVKLLGRQVVVESIQNKVAICRDPEHPSNTIKVSTDTVIAACWRTGHWMPV